MEDTAAARELAKSYRVCAEVLGTVGHRIDPEALSAQVVRDAGESDAVREAVADLCAGRPNRADIPPALAERMHQLRDELLAEVSAAAAGLAERDVAPERPEELVELLKALPDAQKEAVADFVLLNGHRQLFEPRFVKIGAFRRLIAKLEEERPLALVRVVPYLREELEKRGFSMTDDEVRTLFEPGTEATLVPRCLVRIVRRLGREFYGGLIPIEQMVGDCGPDDWLEEVRRKLRFRSHTAMHKAIAEATSLKYDCIHKALSGSQKAKHIQAEIKYCLDKWLKALDEGREPDICGEYRGVPVESVQGFLPRLEQRFDSKESLYRAISERTGVKAGSVRRYFHSGGQLKYAPLSVFRVAEELATQPDVQRLEHTYLADEQTRLVAQELAQRANRVLRQWRKAGETPELEVAYKQLRHALIATIKERRHTSVAV